MNLELLKMFYTIARAGNLTKAAQLLNTSQSSLSRSMQLFEHQMKAKLFKRHPRGLYLTLEGEKVFKHATALIQENEDFVRSFHNKDDEIKGEIKIITTPYLAENEIVPNLLPFLEEYPQLSLEIKTVSEDFDLEGSDIIIRSFIPYRPELEQLPLITHHHQLWASNEYLQKFGTPQTPQDLDKHRLLAFSMNIHNKLLFNYCLTWLLYVGSSSDRPRKPFLQLSSQSGLLKAACEGYGILQFPEEWIQIKKAPLVKIPLDLEYPTSEVHFIFEKKHAKSKKITTLYKYLFECLNKSA